MPRNNGSRRRTWRRERAVLRSALYAWDAWWDNANTGNAGGVLVNGTLLRQQYADARQLVNDKSGPKPDAPALLTSLR